MPVFIIILTAGCEPNETLRRQLEDEVVRHLGKALRPEKILFVTDFPRTRNAKIVRRVMRARYLGHDTGDISALENPEAIEAIGHAV